MLDKGQEDDWFGSPLIVTFTILALIGIGGAIFWELCVTKDPIVDLPLFRDRSFAFTGVMMFATMFVLLATTQLLPQFVQQLLSYGATKAGLTLMPGGFVIMALMPVIGFLVRKVQPKYLITVGFLASALALYHLSGFEQRVSFRSVAIARILQAAGVAFLFVPINTLAFSSLPEGKSSNGSALMKLMRNLGGSVGISLATTVLVRRTQIHQDQLVTHLTPTAIPFQHQLQSLIQRFAAHGAGPTDAAKRAAGAIMAQVQEQALILSYLDIFVILAIGCLIAAGLSALLKSIDLKKAPIGG